MRGKRSKQYRKLMNHYGLSFNFREPYQVLVDAQMVQDAARFKMNLPMSLERTLHGKVKLMITQCCIRHLYTADASDPAAKNFCIESAKTFERRRCNHHTLPEPLSTLECLNSVVDPKSSGTNKHRYVVASQDQKLRANMRNIAGVPLVYINRSVMIMEPMAAKSEQVRDTEERSKFRAGLKSRRGQTTDATSLKRKRSGDSEDDDMAERDEGQEGGAPRVRTADTNGVKKRKGPKAPNPLSVKKSKKTNVQTHENEAAAGTTKKDSQAGEKVIPVDGAALEEHSDALAKRKRRRKHKASGGEAVSDLLTDSAIPLNVEA